MNEKSVYFVVVFAVVFFTRRLNLDLILMNLNSQSIFVDEWAKERVCADAVFFLVFVPFNFNYIFETTQQTPFSPRNVGLTDNKYLTANVVVCRLYYYLLHFVSHGTL